MFFQGYMLGLLILVIGLTLVIAVLSIWWRDVIREALFQGMQDSKHQDSQFKNKKKNKKKNIIQ